MAKAEARSPETAAEAEMLRSINPGTGEVVAECRACTVQEVGEAVARARAAQPGWEALGVRGRARMLAEVRHRVFERRDDIVQILAAENRKPTTEALVHDVFPTLLTLRYLEWLAPRFVRPRARGRIAGAILGISSRIEWRPFGVVGVISPWNYPFTLTFMAAAPALVAGNTVVIKPSEMTPGSGELIREMLEPLPPGAAEVVQGGPSVGQALVDAPCDKITFTGSTQAGRKVAEAAGRSLTPVVLELGGQDAAIVCSDADLDVASSGVLWGSFMNAGQTCAAIERCYVVDTIADRFEELLVEKVRALRPVQDVGPLTLERQYKTVERQVDDAVSKGATVLAGGSAANGPNVPRRDLWFAPTVLEGRTEDMDLYREEVFGPVLPVVRVLDEEEAVARCNGEGYNLTVSVWTSDASRGRAMARGIEAGSVTINDHAITAGTPWGPWGGVGQSGYGRLYGEEGLREFLRPIHIARNTIPRFKRPWWYPYDEATQEALGAIVELLGARKLRRQVTALARVPAATVRAMRQKL